METFCVGNVMADISLHQDGGGIGRRYRARASALFFSHSSGWRQGTHLGGGPPDRGPVKSDFVWTSSSGKGAVPSQPTAQYGGPSSSHALAQHVDCGRMPGTPMASMAARSSAVVTK